MQRAAVWCEAVSNAELPPGVAFLNITVGKDGFLPDIAEVSCNTMRKQLRDCFEPEVVPRNLRPLSLGTEGFIL